MSELFVITSSFRAGGRARWKVGFPSRTINRAKIMLSEQNSLGNLFRFFSCCHEGSFRVAAVMVAGVKNSPIFGGNRELISVAVSLFGRATANRSPNFEHAGKGSLVCLLLPIPAAAWVPARCAAASSLLRVACAGFALRPQPAGAI